jgi:hypothetical protein
MQSPRILLLWALLGLASLARGQDVPRAVRVRPERQAAVAAVLLGALDGEVGDAEGQLVELGTDHLPELFAVLIDGRVTTYEEGQAQVLQLPARLAGPVRGALAQHPFRDVRAFLGDLVRRRPTEPEQRTALELLGRLGAADDVVLLARLADAPSGEQRVGRIVRSAFEQSLDRLLGNHPEARGLLDEVFLEAHPSHAAALVRRIGEAPPREALHELARLLGRMPEADALVLAELGTAGAQLVPPADVGVLDDVRRYLNASRPELVVVAAVAAGKLRDDRAVPELIGLLEDSLAATRAGESLRTISGQRFRNAASWVAWYQAESTWWDTMAAEQLSTLATGAPAEVSKALMAVSRKCVYRHEISRAVVDVLRRDERDLLLMSCAVLGHLGSNVALPELIDALEHPYPEVRAAALKALRDITGRDHGSDPQAWGAELP